MPRLDDTRPFLPVNIAILTVSDTRSEADDKSGATLAELATKAGHRVVFTLVPSGPGRTRARVCS